jgi:hypothetical protein
VAEDTAISYLLPCERAFLDTQPVTSQEHATHNRLINLKTLGFIYARLVLMFNIGLALIFGCVDDDDALLLSSLLLYSSVIVTILLVVIIVAIIKFFFVVFVFIVIVVIAIIAIIRFEPQLWR